MPRAATPKRKPARKASSPAEPGPLRRWLAGLDPVAARRLGGAALFVFVSVGIAIGLVLVAARVESRATETLRTVEARFEFAWPGPSPDRTWLPEEFRADLRHLAALHLGERDPLSQEPLARLGESLAASGWFDGQPTIRREPGSTIRIDGVWRVPVASVRVMGNDLPVSRQGRIMPIPYEVGQSGQPVVFGMQGLPPLRADGSLDYAARWDARDLDAGLELLDALRTQPYFDRITGVDVGDFASRGMLVLVVNTGARIVWGGRAGVFNPGEIPTPMKLQRLDRLFVHEAEGRLNQPSIVFELYHEGGTMIPMSPPQGQE
ncbi:MAG: hypothetical protein R3B68_03430 [Phycisphaerales bacterium]